MSSESNAQMNTLEIRALGAGNEVGRSCILIRYQGKTIMLDCGTHPAKTGLDALPYFDYVDPSTIDLLLVTQFVILLCFSLRQLIFAFFWPSVQFPFGSLCCLALFPHQDAIQRKVLHDPSDEIDLSTDCRRFPQSEVCQPLLFW